MGFLGKKGGHKIDAFGPGDILIGSSGRLPDMYAQHVIQYVTDDVFVDEAMLLASRMHRDDVEVFNQICRFGFASAVSLAKQRENAREREELRLVFSLTEKCLQIFGFQLVANERQEELSLMYAAVKGAIRMVELRRAEQAMGALALAVMITANVIDKKAGKVQIFTASWGENGVNKCTFFINEKGEVSWSPQSIEPSLVAEERIMTALAELEFALGRAPTFREELEAQSQFFDELVRDGIASVSEVKEPFFKWDPPLSDIKTGE